MRILACGAGNDLKGDDGFGVHAIRELARRSQLPDSVTCLESGIGGIHLVQELMRGYDALLLFDAHDVGGSIPGTLRLLDPQLPDIEDWSDSQRRDFFADTHYATPVRALSLAKAVGALPPLVRIIGCQPHAVDGFGEPMHPAVLNCVASAVEMALDLLLSWVERREDVERRRERIGQ